MLDLFVDMGNMAAMHWARLQVVKFALNWVAPFDHVMLETRTIDVLAATIEATPSLLPEQKSISH